MNNEDIKRLEELIKPVKIINYSEYETPIFEYKINKLEREAIKNLIKGYKELEKENRILREYINFAPNLDEMSALEFKNIQEQSYLRGRNDENINYKNYVENNCIEKSKVREKIEEQYGRLCMELGSYERDNATPHQERIAGGINELRKLRKELLQEGADK